MKKTLLLLLCIAVAAGLAFLVGYRSGRNRVLPSGQAVIADTVVVRDTLTVVKPSPVKVVERVRVDTVYLAVVDTLIILDSVLVEVPIGRRVYVGDDYGAVVSGYRATLDSISVYPETKYVTVTVREQIKPKRVALGLAAGPTVVYNGKVHGGFGLTGGILVRF